MSERLIIIFGIICAAGCFVAACSDPSPNQGYPPAASKVVSAIPATDGYTKVHLYVDPATSCEYLVFSNASNAMAVTPRNYAADLRTFQRGCKPDDQ